MLDSEKVQCPYCGEVIEILVEPSLDQQNYVEDCQVCCCPITVDVTVELDGPVRVSVNREND